MTVKHGAPIDTATALRDAVGRFVRSVRNQTGTATTAQSEVLAQLAREGPSSVALLAEARGVRHQSLRLVVARLVELELLAVTPDPLDGRSQVVALTRKGRAEVKTDQAARSAYLARTIAARLDAREIAVLQEALGLLDRISAAS